MAKTTFFFANRITKKDRVFVVRQLSIMLSSGIPILNALNLLSDQSDKASLQAILRVITKDIENGHPFSEAAARHPQLFDDVTLAMLKTGEASGQMNTVLSDMAVQLDRDLDFSGKVRNALLYPGVVVLVMIIVGIIMTTVIIPRLSGLFEESAVQLPWNTRLLIGISNLIMTYWYVLVIILIGGIYALRHYLSTTIGRARLYRLQTRIPVVKDLIMNTYLVRFSRLLAMLVHSGVPITEGLRIVGSAMANRLWQQSLTTVQSEVEHGIPLSTALSRHDIFPSQLIQMVSVGEQTGKLDSVLENLANYYEEQTNTSIKSVTALLEPTILVVVALAVGFVVVSVILPIYGISDQF